MDQMRIEPFSVRTSVSIVILALFVGDDTLLYRIHQKDAPGSESGFLYDLFRLDRKNADLG